MEARFVARTSRVRVAVYVVGSLVLMLLSLFMAGLFGEPPRPGREWIGWIGAGLFGLLGGLAALRLRGSADQIVIDAAGLTWRQWSDEHIPWTAVRGIEERRVQRQTFFAVYLDDAEAHPPTRLLGKVARAQAGFGQGHFTIIAHGTDRSVDDLREALRVYWAG